MNAKEKRPFNFEKTDVRLSVDKEELHFQFRGPVVDFKLKKPDLAELKEKTKAIKEKTAALKAELREDLAGLKLKTAALTAEFKDDLDRLKKPDFGDEAKFLKQWLENPLKTGALSPSSKELSRAMAAPVDLSIPGDIVELGPGTGPVTEALIERGVPPERLVLIEYNPDFIGMLSARFPGVRVVQGDAYKIRKTLSHLIDAKIAAVVSSLPLVNRPEEERLRLVHEAFSMMQPGAPFIQFTYSPVSPVPLKGQLIKAKASKRIWKNLPPARVWTYRRG